MKTSTSVRRPNSLESGRKFRFWGYPQTVALPLYIVALFLLGGSSRADVPSLVLLRPMAALFLGYALWSLPSQSIRDWKPLLIGMALVVALALLHMIPLPSLLWGVLPGRQIIVEVDRVAGIAGSVRPLTLSPAAGWNAVFSLMVPAGVLLLGIRANSAGHLVVLRVFVAAILTSAVLAIGQTIASGGSGYLLTFTDTSVGFFANRNHQAVLLACGLPMLGALFLLQGARPGSAYKWLVPTGAIFLFIMTIGTGSRAGIVLGVIGAALCWAMLATTRAKLATDRPSIAKRSWLKLAGIAAAVIATGSLIAVSFARSRTAERIFASDSFEDQRWETWSATMSAIMTYMPVGSGIGSFAEVFQIHEPLGILTPRYINHAHNEVLEIGLTLGLPGLLLLGAALMAIGSRAFRVWKTPVEAGAPSSASLVLARSGSIVLLLLGIASCVDYPLRVPSLAALGVMATIWLFYPGRASASTGPRQSNGKRPGSREEWTE